MGKQNFSKEKVQVQYTVKTTFKKDDKELKNYADDAAALISKIESAKDEWGFDFAINAKKDKAEITRIKSIVYPRTNNGHVGEDGHNWQWQLDVETMGKGSKVRLYLDDVKASVSTQKQGDDTVKVGSDQYTVITCEVQLTGTFSAGQKH